jgi:hypothetical protein
LEPAHHPRPQIPKQLEGVFLGIPFQTEVGLVKPNAEHIEADLVLALGPAGERDLKLTRGARTDLQQYIHVAVKFRRIKPAVLPEEAARTHEPKCRQPCGRTQRVHGERENQKHNRATLAQPKECIRVAQQAAKTDPVQQERDEQQRLARPNRSGRENAKRSCGQILSSSPNRPRYCAGDGMVFGSAGGGGKQGASLDGRRSMPRW